MTHTETDRDTHRGRPRGRDRQTKEPTLLEATLSERMPYRRPVVWSSSDGNVARATATNKNVSLSVAIKPAAGLAGDAVAVAVMLAMLTMVVVAVNCVRRINTSPSATASAGICWQFSGSARAVTLPSGSGQKGVLFFRRFFSSSFFLFLFPFVFVKVVSGYRGTG